jgi:hypothetical protein
MPMTQDDIKQIFGVEDTVPEVSEAEYIEQLCEMYSNRELLAMAEDEQDPEMKRIMLNAAEHG